MPRKTFVAGDVLTAADMNLLAQDGYIDNTDLDTTAGQPGGAWVSYTPTCDGISNTTRTGAYMKLGKTVFFRAKVLLTGTSSVTATAEISLPLASAELVRGADGRRQRAAVVLGAGHRGQRRQGVDLRTA
jgi:hypothetical protein